MLTSLWPRGVSCSTHGLRLRDPQVTTCGKRENRAGDGGQSAEESLIRGQRGGLLHRGLLKEKRVSMLRDCGLPRSTLRRPALMLSPDRVPWGSLSTRRFCFCFCRVLHGQCATRLCRLQGNRRRVRPGLGPRGPSDVIGWFPKTLDSGWCCERPPTA